MADFRRGIEAGVTAGFVYLVIYIFIGVVFARDSFYLTNLLYAAGLMPFASPLYPAFFPSFGIFSNVVRGIIFGVVFAALYNFLPGIASIVKGVVLSSFLWIVTVIEVIYTMPEWSGVRGTYYGGTVNLSSPSLLLIGIMVALLFGALTGLLWDRFRGKELTEERKGRSVLLVSFILGGIIWVSFALMFLVGRIPLTVIGPELLWEQIVTRLVLFAGLPGWVLILIGWRKTKVHKSGFRWGVAGGTMMALTGIMLLPGALAIAGGVFSGRKPASESSTTTVAQ